RLGGRRERLLLEGDGVGDPHVLGVERDLPARERLLDQLRGADVLLVGDVEALRLERLLVQLAEDERLAEVLGADDDRRRGRPGASGRCRAGSAHDDRDPEGDRERRLGGAPGVLADHVSSDLFGGPGRPRPYRVDPSFPGSATSIASPGWRPRRGLRCNSRWTIATTPSQANARPQTRMDAPITPSI